MEAIWDCSLPSSSAVEVGKLGGGAGMGPHPPVGRLARGCAECLCCWRVQLVGEWILGDHCGLPRTRSPPSSLTRQLPEEFLISKLKILIPSIKF